MSIVETGPSVERPFPNLDSRVEGMIEDLPRYTAQAGFPEWYGALTGSRDWQRYLSQVWLVADPAQVCWLSWNGTHEEKEILDFENLRVLSPGQDEFLEDAFRTALYQPRELCDLGQIGGESKVLVVLPESLMDLGSCSPNYQNLCRAIVANPDYFDQTILCFGLKQAREWDQYRAWQKEMDIGSRSALIWAFSKWPKYPVETQVVEETKKHSRWQSWLPWNND